MRDLLLGAWLSFCGAVLLHFVRSEARTPSPASPNSTAPNAPVGEFSQEPPPPVEWKVYRPKRRSDGEVSIMVSGGALNSHWAKWDAVACSLVWLGDEERVPPDVRDRALASVVAFVGVLA